MDKIKKLIFYIKYQQIRRLFLIIEKFVSFSNLLDLIYGAISLTWSIIVGDINVISHARQLFL